MTMTTHHEPASAHRKWTAFELTLLGPFLLLGGYVASQPLVLPVKPAQVAAAVAAVVPAPADPDAPVFVSANTTLLQRIAPVARVKLDDVQALLTPTEPAEAVAAPAAPASEPVAPVAEVPAPSTLRIDITDATGMPGLAEDLAAQLEKSGVSVARAGTAPAGAQRRTVILYRDGFEADAARLGRLFARPPALVMDTRPGTDRADVRLLLGSAAAREKLILAAGASLSGN